MMLSAPAADNEMYSLLLLRLVSDPDGAKKRLDELSSAATANAEAYRQQLQGIEDAKAAAHDTIAKAAADEDAARLATEQAGILSAKNGARSAELNRLESRLNDEAADLDARERGLKEAIAAHEAANAERERMNGEQADQLASAMKNIVAEQAAVAALKSDLEDRTAKLKALLA